MISIKNGGNSPFFLNIPCKIDLRFLEEVAGKDEKFKKELLDAFLEHMPQDLETLRIHIKAENFTKAAKLAHKIKTPLQVLGCSTTHISHLEGLLKASNPIEEIHLACENLSIYILKVIEEVKKLLA